MLPLPGIELTGKSGFSQTFPIAFGSLFNKTLLSASRLLLANLSIRWVKVDFSRSRPIRSGFYQIKFYDLIAGRMINLHSTGKGKAYYYRATHVVCYDPTRRILTANLRTD
jgi:hypothetical protein